MNERSRLDRDKAEHYVRLAMPVAYSIEELVDVLDEECVLPDPRIARIKALCDEMDQYQVDSPGYPIVRVEQIRAILAGGDV